MGHYNLILPGVGGSNEQHWQSWLEAELGQCVRIEQQWDRPILNEWVKQTVNTLEKYSSFQIIAHSFGCLTSIATLARFPELKERVKKLVLVAPANPARFSPTGFAHQTTHNFTEYFKGIEINVPNIMLVSENDPWFEFDQVTQFAQNWNAPYLNLGQVGHINTESGFGQFPELLNHLYRS